MNPYVGREEKEHLVRITALAIMLGNVIDIYAKLKSTDKQFVTHLRKARTWLTKAIKLRESYLPLDSRRDLCRSVDNMRLLLVPSDKAKKEFEEMMKLKSVFPFEMEDFNDLYAELIETTCKVCVRSDYEDCQARRVMVKYGVFPYNPAATVTCQFSYVDSEAISSEPPAPEAVGGLAQALLEMAKVTRPIPEVVTEPEEPAPDGLKTVTVSLISGQQLRLRMNEYMAQHLLSEIQRPQRQARGTVACHFGGKLLVVDMTEVATIQTDDLPDLTWTRQPVTLAAKQQHHQPAQIASRNDSNTGETERFSLKCKCGSKYFLTLQADTTRAKCRYCGAPVFVDRQAERVLEYSSNTQAVLLTNTYFVQQPRADNLPPVSPAAFSGKRGYDDPCNPFA